MSVQSTEKSNETPISRDERIFKEFISTCQGEGIEVTNEKSFMDLYTEFVGKFDLKTVKIMLELSPNTTNSLYVILLKRLEELETAGAGTPAAIN